jgi:two-component system chemotaxis response regulator CheY
VFENGQQVLDYLESVPVPPRLILLDLMMPIMDGWEVLNRLRMSQAFASIPLVIISAFYGKSARLQATPTPVRVLEKPLDIEKLLAIVRDACAPPSAVTRG